LSHGTVTIKLADEESIREAARIFSVDRITRKLYIYKQRYVPIVAIGYKNYKRVKIIFSCSIKTELAECNKYLQKAITAIKTKT